MPKCGDCLYWRNQDDPADSCSLSPRNSADDEAYEFPDGCFVAYSASSDKE